MRPLTKYEVDLISGGMEDGDGDTITVTADPSDSSSTWSSTSSDSTSTSSSSSDNDDGGSEDPPDNEFPCENTAVSSVSATIAAKDSSDGQSGTAQPEYGATIANASGSFITGNIVTGQSYDEANPPSTTISPPTGYSWSDVVATVHSHPPSGDAATDLRNQAPSDGDWQAADAAVAAGADPDALTMYIIDKDGTMRSFDYMSPSERGATASNPSGTQNSGADGAVVDPNSAGCD